MYDLLLCILGIYGCFLTWGVLQERVSTTSYGVDQERFQYFIFLNSIQSLTSSIVALFYLRLIGKPLLKGINTQLLKLLGQVSLTNALASPFGYLSLKHINYPTLVLGKSCKLVPVMLMNILLYRRKYPFKKYMSVALITLGVSGFMLLQSKTSTKQERGNSLFGLLLIAINLMMDGATNSTQDQIFHLFKFSGQQMMCLMNLVSFFYMSIWLLNPWNPELTQALTFCTLHPNVIKDIVMFSLCGSLGQCFIFYTLEKYGSLLLVTVTVTRKLFTMLLSVFWFNHQLSLGQWLSVAVVFFWHWLGSSI